MKYNILSGLGTSLLTVPTILRINNLITPASSSVISKLYMPREKK